MQNEGVFIFIDTIMIQLIEPYWGVTLLTTLFTWMQASVFWSYWIPVMADIFVFFYPLYLLGLYVYGTVHMWRFSRPESLAHALRHKVAALYILFGTSNLYFSSKIKIP